MNRPTNIAIGQEVFIVKSHGFYDPSYTLAKVSKYSEKTGQVTVEYHAPAGAGLIEMRFKRDDTEYGGSYSNGRRLSWGVEKIKTLLMERAAMTSAREYVARASNALMKFSDKSDRTQALARIAEARAELDAAELALKEQG